MPFDVTFKRTGGEASQTKDNDGERENLQRKSHTYPLRYVE